MTTAAPLRLTPGEIRAVMSIEQRAFPHPWSLEDFEWLAGEEKAIKLGLWRAEQLVGYAIGTVDGRSLHLASLAVEEGFRRQGWGSQLLQAVLQRGQEHGCRDCELEVRRSNEAALHLYRRFGFAVNGVRRRFYTNPVEDAWRMRRSLAAERSRRT